ncbi:unnamed protein product, partial [marine sediment metagenome]
PVGHGKTLRSDGINLAYWCKYRDVMVVIYWSITIDMGN